jgi:hypothetical protein
METLMSSKSKSKNRSAKPRSNGGVAKKKSVTRTMPRAKIPIGPVGGVPVDIPAGLQVVNAPKTSLKNFLTNGAEERSAPRLERQAAKSYAAIATHAWRAKGRIVDSDTGEPKEGMERICRHIEGILQALEEDSVLIKDYAGGIYDTGMAVKALAFEPTPGINREMVKETIRPTIIFNNQVLQLGEVIVGTPIEETDNNEGENHAPDNN